MGLNDIGLHVGSDIKEKVNITAGQQGAISRNVQWRRVMCQISLVVV